MRPQWTTEWQAEDQLLRVESAPLEAGGRPTRLHRVVTGIGAGAGAVAVASRDGSVLLVRQVRIIPGVTLWELPRGSADTGDVDLVATARRELTEETGLTTLGGELLGHVYPDTGLLAARVGIVLVHVGEGATSEPDGEVEEADWFPLDGIAQMVARGDVCDGITLAALALAEATGGIARD